MTIGAGLVAALKVQVLSLEDDLRRRLDEQHEVSERWRSEHRRLVTAERTAASWTEWRDDRVTQAAVAWVLTSVFVRFCEDNALVKPVWIAGPASRRQEALDAQLAYFRGEPEATDREWLMQSVDYLKRLPATRSLVDDHSPLWSVSPSGQAVTSLLAFWRDRDEQGELRWDFAADDWSTRFLGDLYQDLSEHAKKTYALLQTPEFVEEFILDQTLEPALKERPLDGFSMIDPTCGSGHFLLGAFHRLLEKWKQQAPGMETQERVKHALAAVHGVDLNPFAVAIARFRLTVAALRACGLRSLEQAPGFTYRVATGDSLLVGRRPQDELPGLNEDEYLTQMTNSTEDLPLLRTILVAGRYDVVVGNPPYVTVKDKKLNRAYRERYLTCKGTYALTVPFMERFFDLAKPARGDQPAGWVGQITSNSFMKREFGSKLIEEFLVKQDLRLVADTSGAYIPGHGTPTVIITGRHQPPVGSTIRAVLGIRGEPGRPEQAEHGLVWTSIAANIDQACHQDQWVTVTDLDRDRLGTHPWALAGGGASNLAAALELGATPLLKRIAPPIGGSIRAGADEAFLRPRAVRMQHARSEHLRPIVTGDIVRDWNADVADQILFPYLYGLGHLRQDAEISAELWPWRTALASRSTFQGNMADARLAWWEYMQFTNAPYRTPLSITFAFVATHNHFVLDRGGKVFNRSAPVIKLPEGASEDDHLGLLGVLNSSTACFWLKQNSYPKGGDPVGDDGARVSQQPWSDRYEFTGTTLQDYPLPERLPLSRAQVLDDLALRWAAQQPTQVTEPATPTVAMLDDASTSAASLRAQMIAQQEELDWEVYGLYGLPGGDLVYPGDDLPEIALGERSFEIALARKVAAGEEDTAWFTRHGSTPITEIPPHWPEAYRDLVQQRLDLIESDPAVSLLESPEHKRRWASESWETLQDRALRGWLLDRLEDRSYWFTGPTPAPKSLSQLADTVSRDADLVSVLALWEGRPDVPIVQSLTRLMVDQAVPYLAAYRFKDSGLRKFAAWQETWDLQRREDAGDRLTEPIPPKYTNADFRKASWWQARGKLDVPKERFILYPDAGRATDPSPLLGWAGWDHAEQSLALATIIGEREAEGRPDTDLVPLVAGLAEVQPWVEQWHAGIDPRYGQSLAVFCREQLTDRARQVAHTLDQLAAWRPAAPTRGRKART